MVDTPTAAERAIVKYLARELPDLHPRLGIARDVILALAELPIESRMEAMGMAELKPVGGVQGIWSPKEDVRG